MKPLQLPLGLLLLAQTMRPAILLAQECEGPVEIPDARYLAARDGTVKDRATGLMWKQCPEGLSGVGCAVGEALAFNWNYAIDQGVDAVFAGYSDWRLPTRTELMSLLLRRCYGVDIDVANFPNTPADYFWTSTPAPYYADSAWAVHFGTGIPDYGTGRDAAYVRLVRDSAACSPANLGPCTVRPAPGETHQSTHQQAPTGLDPLAQ